VFSDRQYLNKTATKKHDRDMKQLCESTHTSALQWGPVSAAWKGGLHAEFLASVVTAGNAKDKDGSPLEISNSARRIFDYDYKGAHGGGTSQLKDVTPKLMFVGKEAAELLGDGETQALRAHDAGLLLLLRSL